jgi:hypothetical protein
LDIPLFASSEPTDDATSAPGGENWEQEGFFNGPFAAAAGFFNPFMRAFDFSVRPSPSGNVFP